jgi:hypothetical protein
MDINDILTHHHHHHGEVYPLHRVIHPILSKGLTQAFEGFEGTNIQVLSRIIYTKPTTHTSNLESPATSVNANLRAG